MIQVILRLVARPRCTPDMIQALRSLMVPLPAASGFISCRLYADPESPETLCYIEEWQNPEDLDRQILSSHYTRLLALMEDAAEAPEFRVNWIGDVKGLEYLEAVRLSDC